MHEKKQVLYIYYDEKRKEIDKNKSCQKTGGGDKLNIERLLNKCRDKEVQPFFFYNALIKKGSVFKILNCLTVKFSINSGGI